MLVRKASIMILLLSLFTLSNAQEIILKPEIEKKINLKTEKVKIAEVVEYQTFPAVVTQDPTLSYAVSSPVEGIAERVYVKLGDHVKKGQILLTVYSPTIASLQANIEMAKVKLQTAKQVLEREENLYKEEVIPFARYQTAKIEYERSLGEYQALKKALSSYGEVKGNSIILRSKVNGFVADIKVINGNPVNVGEELMRIHSHERLWVIAQVPFEITKDLKIGQKVIVISPLNKEIIGTLSLISREIDPKTRRNDIRIVVNNVENSLKPNLFVNVKLPLKSTNGVLVPLKAVFQEKDKYYCFVKSGNKVILREVKIAEKVGDFYKVVSGLKEGEEVITDGLIFLKTKAFGGAEE
jgi:cobalt-zinc-cadmium efflux system membrane fusion protein